MPTDMKAYLASKYMSGPKADAILSRSQDGTLKKKKKKRKHDELTSTSVPTLPSSSTSKPNFLVDEDIGWGNAGSGTVEDEEGEESEGEKAIVASDRGFKKRRKEDSGWTTVRGKSPTPPPAEDEKPQVVLEEEEEQAKPFKGGLLSAKELKKALPAKKESQLTEEEAALAQETVYRDKSGKKIDTKAAKAEAARLKREREEKEAAKMEWGKGVVQKEEVKKRKDEMEKLKNRPFARTVEDKELNEDLKAKEMWNDPAAAFLTVSVV